jgi:hypothetical protein
VKLFRASPEDIVGALLMPSPRAARHDVLAAADDEATTVAVLPRPRNARGRAIVPTGLSDDVERRLAHLAGIDIPAPAPFDDVQPAQRVSLAPTPSAYSHHLLRVAQIVAVGGLLLIAAAAALSARFDNGGLRVHPLAFAGWGLGATIAAITLASLSSDPAIVVASSARRRSLAALLFVGLLVCVSGVVTSAGGVAGPSWVLFFPVVLICGAVVGPTLGVAVGGSAATGLYVSAALSHTLGVAGLGRLVVLLPSFPAS